MVNIIGLVFLGIGILVSIALIFGFGAQMITVYVPELQDTSLLPIVGAVVAFFSGVSLVVGIFVTRAIFKGYRWAIVFSLILTALQLLGSLANLEIISIVINAVVIYAEIICL